VIKYLLNSFIINFKIEFAKIPQSRHCPKKQPVNAIIKRFSGVSFCVCLIGRAKKMSKKIPGLARDYEKKNCAIFFRN